MIKATIIVLVLSAAFVLHFPATFALASFFQSIPLSLYVIGSITATFATLVAFGARGGLFASAVLAVSWIAAFGDILGGASAEPKKFKPFSVVTWNTQYWDQTEGLQELGKQLEKLDADILVLQEHIHQDIKTSTIRSINRTEVLRKCCSFENIWSKGELVIASRISGKLISEEDPYLLVVSMGQDENQKNIINAHVPVHVDIGLSPFQKDFWTYIASRNQPRLNTLRALHKILGSSGSAVVGGDFNSTILMPPLRKALLRTTDFGISDLWPPTYPAGKSIPELWRLDLLLGKNAGIRRCRVVRLPDVLTSDHWPVRCTFGVT